MRTCRAVLMVLVAVVLSVVSCAALESKEDAPKRVDGLVEATIAPSKAKYETEEERLELAKKAQAKRAALLEKFPPPTARCRRVRDGGVKVRPSYSNRIWWAGTRCTSGPTWSARCHRPVRGGSGAASAP